MTTLPEDRIEIIESHCGTLAVNVSSLGDMIDAGTPVDIFVLRTGRELCVKVRELASLRNTVYLPYYGTDIDWLLGKVQ